MPQGPLIISDDGGPPDITRAQGGFSVKVSLGMEPMDELAESANGQHEISNSNTFAITEVTLLQGGEVTALVKDPGTVQVIGNAYSVISARVNENDSMEVDSDVQLVRSYVPDYIRYSAPDAYILKVIVDGANILKPNGGVVRVIINIG